MHKNNSALITAVAVFMAAAMVCSCFAVVESDDASADKMENRNYEIFGGIDVSALIEGMSEVEISSLGPMVSLMIGLAAPSPQEFPTDLDPAALPDGALVVSGPFSVDDTTEGDYTTVYVCDGAEITLCGDSTITAKRVVFQGTASIDREESSTSAIVSEAFTIGGLPLDMILGTDKFALSGENASISGSYSLDTENIAIALSLDIKADQFTMSKADGTDFVFANHGENKALSVSL